MVTSQILFTAAQKAELWERWKNGQSAAAISRALERRNKTGVERIVVLHGGIEPAPRQRALVALRLEEREEISRGIAVGRSIRQIAQGLGRAPSTVSREIRRNGGSQAYRANEADRRAWKRASRPKPCRLALHSELRWQVAQKLALQWSPEQISGWLATYTYPRHCVSPGGTTLDRPPHLTRQIIGWFPSMSLERRRAPASPRRSTPLA